MAIRDLRFEEPDAETAALVAELRAQNPNVVLWLWDRYAVVVFRVLSFALRGARVSFEAAAQEVFLQVFRWGPHLSPDANLRIVIVRAITRTVERLSKPTRSIWRRSKRSRTIRARSNLAEW